MKKLIAKMTGDRLYWGIFGGLVLLTALTVLTSGWHFGGAVAIAFLIAISKGTLVANYFMHLGTEKRAIYAIVFFGLFFALVLFVLTILTQVEAWGCPACYRESEVVEPTLQSMDTGIALMMGIVGSVLSAFAVTFLRWARRSRSVGRRAI